MRCGCEDGEDCTKITVCQMNEALQEQAARIEQLEYENETMLKTLHEEGIRFDFCDIVATRKAEALE